MGHRRRILLVAIALFAAIAVAPASAAPTGNGEDARERHARVTAYWTAERIANAIPRDLVVDAATGRRVPQGKGGGGGGVNCKKPANQSLPECGGGGGEEPPPTEDPSGPPATTTGANWTGSIYDTSASDVRHVVGKVLFTLGSTNYVCSGSVVADGSVTDNRALVLTAGHCVHDGDGTTWATNWTFIPDFDRDADGSVSTCSDSPHGCWIATSLVTTAAWANSSDFSYDVGFAVMGVGGKSSTQLEAMLAGQSAAPMAVGFHRTRGEHMTAFGYPHASPYNGKRLVYCAGDAQPYHYWFGQFLYSYDQGLSCTMTGGSSGGPWYGAFETSTGRGVATSVNSYKMSNDARTMYGPYFGNYAQKTYDEAVTATGNKTTSAPATLP